ncbi:hypothetical protein HY522_01340 [bacterium]|nr:hypothetical protein [bacterium]
MVMRIFFACVAFLLFTFAGPSLPAADAAEILKGTLTEMSGDVQIQRRGSSVPSTARRGIELDPGDVVITGMSGRAVVTFEQGRLQIDPSSRVVLVRCVASRDEAYSELALPYGSVTAYINMERQKEYWFDIVTLTTHAQGRGRKKEVSQISVTHKSGSTTVTDSQQGQWRLAPVILTDQAPAVQAALKQDARAPEKMNEYLTVTLSDDALRAYEVNVSGGVPDFAGAKLTITPAAATVVAGKKATFAAAGGLGKYKFSISENKSGGTIDATTGKYTAGTTGGVTDVVRVTDENGNSAEATVDVEAEPVVQVTSPPPPAPTVPPLSLTVTLQEGKCGIVSGSSTVTSGGTK